MKKYKTPNSVSTAIEIEVPFVASSHFRPYHSPCEDCKDRGTGYCFRCVYRRDQEYFRNNP